MHSNTRNLRFRRRDALKLMATGVTGMLISACNGKSRTQSQPVKIGFLTALTGLETILGETQLNCFRLAVDEINAEGGINGRKVEFVIEDDQTSTRGCVEKARKLIFDDKVDVIIGLISSLEHVATREVTSPARTLLIYTTYYEGGVIDKYFAATGQVPNQQIEPTTDWLIENLGKSVYVLGSDYVWPRKSYEAIKSAFESRGGRVLGNEFFPFGTQDFGPAFQRVRAARPDMVWTMFAGADGVTALKEYRNFEMEAPLVSNGLDEVISFAHPDLTKGIISNQSYFMTIDSAANRRFVASYENRYGPKKPINAIGEAAYTATRLYGLAVGAAGSTDVEGVIQALPTVRFDAPQGPVYFDKASAHLVSNSLLGKADADGNWKIVKSFGQIPPKFPA